jgi:PAS domain S-box-containing protein
MSDNRPELPAAEGLSEKDYAMATLRVITVLATAVSTLLIPVVAFSTTNPGEIWTTVTFAAVGWAALLMIRIRRGKYLPHGIIFAALLVATQGVIASGSVRSSVAFLFVGGVAAAGSFLGRKALFAATVYSVSALAALNWAEVSGWIHKSNPEVGLKVWATQSICIVVVGIMVYFTRERARKAHAFQVQELLRRKATEQERDQAKERFARIFGASPSPMMAQSADSALILDVNPAFERCFGYTKAQLVGQSDGMLWVDDNQRREYTKALLQERRQDRQPARGLRASGEQFEAMLSSELSVDSDDKLIITIVTDVSTEHAAMEQLRRSEERFAKAFNLSPLNLTITRLSDGAVVEANRSAQGGQLSPADKPAAHVTPLEAGFWSSADNRQTMAERLQRDGSVRALDTRIQQDNGEWIDCRIWAEPIEIDGEPCALSCTVNVTEEKRREAQLLDLATGMAGHTGQAFFSALVHNMAKTLGADMLFVGELKGPDEVQSLAGTMDGKPIDPFSYPLKGTPCHETAAQTGLCVYRSHVADLFPEDLTLVEGRFEAYLGQSLRDETGQLVGILAALWRKPIDTNPETEAVMSIYGGRTAAELIRLQRDREIQRLNDTLEQRVRSRTAELLALNAELDSFAYSVSHDLKTPLRSIDGFTQILGEQLQGRLSANEENLFQRILASTSRMGVLIADLLDLARISQSDLRWQWVDLSAMAQEVFAALRSDQFSERALALRVEDGLRARCDPQLMRIALVNLLGNAVKYTRGQNPAVIEFAGAQAEWGTSAAFCVRDNGVGFDMASASKLFKPFQRLHPPASGFEGNGIGLATVRRIVERHGGTIRAQSDPDKGTIFTFTLGHPPQTLGQALPPSERPHEHP